MKITIETGENGKILSYLYAISTFLGQKDIRKSSSSKIKAYLLMSQENKKSEKRSKGFTLIPSSMPGQINFKGKNIQNLQNQIVAIFHKLLQSIENKGNLSILL